MDRVFIAIIASALLVLLGAATLLVTRSNLRTASYGISAERSLPAVIRKQIVWSANDPSTDQLERSATHIGQNQAAA